MHSGEREQFLLRKSYGRIEEQEGKLHLRVQGRRGLSSI